MKTDLNYRSLLNELDRRFEQRLAEADCMLDFSYRDSWCLSELAIAVAEWANGSRRALDEWVAAARKTGAALPEGQVSGDAALTRPTEAEVTA